MTKKILIIRLSALGDVIFTLPSLTAIQRDHPDAELSWLVEDKAASILQHRNDLARLVIYPRKGLNKALCNPLGWLRLPLILYRHFRELRRDRYDLILDFQGNLKSGVHLLVARGARKVGYARGHTKELNHLFCRERITPPARAVHRIEKSFSLVKPDFDPGEIRRPDLHLPPDLVKEAEESLKGVLNREDPLLVVHPGTSAFGAFKRWAPERFGLLARRLRAERGFSTLVTWGPGERPLAEGVAGAGGEGVVVAPPSRSLLHLAAFIRRARLYVSADSGPLHIANYLGVPCLALFGPKNPALYRPYFSPSEVVRSDVECGPCTKRHCDDPICMKGLEVEPVFDAVCRLLEGLDPSDGVERSKG